MNSEPDHQQIKSSDQVAVEGPAEQVPDERPEAQEGAAREAARWHARRVSRPRRPADRADEEA
jgi:hypothetical protein